MIILILLIILLIALIYAYFTNRTISGGWRSKTKLPLEDQELALDIITDCIDSGFNDDYINKRIKDIPEKYRFIIPVIKNTDRDELIYFSSSYVGGLVEALIYIKWKYNIEILEMSLLGYGGNSIVYAINKISDPSGLIPFEPKGVPASEVLIRVHNWSRFNKQIYQNVKKNNPEQLALSVKIYATSMDFDEHMDDDKVRRKKFTWEIVQKIHNWLSHLQDEEIVLILHNYEHRKAYIDYMKKQADPKFNSKDGRLAGEMSIPNLGYVYKSDGTPEYIAVDLDFYEPSPRDLEDAYGAYLYVAYYINSIKDSFPPDSELAKLCKQYTEFYDSDGDFKILAARYDRILNVFDRFIESNYNCYIYKSYIVSDLRDLTQNKNLTAELNQVADDTAKICYSILSHMPDEQVMRELAIKGKEQIIINKNKSIILVNERNKQYDALAELIINKASQRIPYLDTIKTVKEFEAIKSELFKTGKLNI